MPGTSGEGQKKREGRSFGERVLSVICDVKTGVVPGQKA